MEVQDVQNMPSLDYYDVAVAVPYTTGMDRRPIHSTPYPRNEESGNFFAEAGGPRYPGLFQTLNLKLKLAFVVG